uniref:Reverse transcriptase domain-containing protein n=1 Tax=Sparus aurata TaxID=8175 RepID=A0A671TQN5_SPAAU
MSTPDLTSRAARQAGAEGPRTPLSAGKSNHARITCCMLKRRKMDSPNSAGGGAPRRKGTQVARRALFPSQDIQKGMLIWSWDKNWRSDMTGQRLPPSVSISLRIPWAATSCDLCDTILSSATKAAQHIQRAHCPYKISYICGKCTGTFATQRKAACHLPKCGVSRYKTLVWTGYPCDHCPKSFSTPRGLSNHKRIKHPGSYAVGKGSGTKSEPVWESVDVAYLRGILESCLVAGARYGGISPSASAKEINLYVRKIQKKLQSVTMVSGQKRRGRTLGEPNPLMRNKHRRYSWVQRKYWNDRGGLARWILDGNEESICGIDPKTVSRAYQKIWGREDEFVTLGRFANLPPIDMGPICSPIAPQEVLGVLSHIKRNSAPGPDGVRRDAWLRWDPKGEKISDLFNAMLLSGRVPTCLKTSRTTLIPKTSDSKQLVDINQWRPITIGPILLRTFSGVLTRRLAEVCKVHTRQKGFVKSSGCSENLPLLDGMIQTCKRNRKPLSVVFIDFAKAFDTVSHNHLWVTLERIGVDDQLVKVIRDSYRGCTTRIRLRGGETQSIELRRGVKQGDPMSPLLFNLSIDPLLRLLECEGAGSTACGVRVASLAFADDLVLLSDSWDGMSRNLAVLERFCCMTGLKVNPKKSHGFSWERNGPRYTLNDCSPWLLDGTPNRKDIWA